jgi:diaminobutyrate-2-oxoglutarate transaminase
MDTKVFERFESNVRSYCRQFPVVFSSAKGAWLTTADGRRYLDLLSGAGTLNYGHNDPAIIDRVVDYMRGDGILHSLDLHTAAKADFLTAFQSRILDPRGLSYKLQFPGPTGTNAIEAALKLARKVTGRSSVVAFTNAFHGMTMGSLATTANPAKRAGAGVSLAHTTFMPYDGFLGPSIDTMDVIAPMLSRPGSGIDKPAAILVELVQGEGGLSSAHAGWLGRLAQLAKDIGALLIVDDIQAGCGRTGRFFSFEGFGIEPDLVVLSKSLSGFGSPFSLVLIRPDLDVWRPGEHNGTFRGNNLAFVGATAAIETYWADPAFETSVQEKAALVHDGLSRIVNDLPAGTAKVKGRGLFIGIEFNDTSVARTAARHLFEEGIVIETCGVDDQVLKLLPPLTISTEELATALDAIGRAVTAALAVRSPVAG